MSVFFSVLVQLGGNAHVVQAVIAHPLLLAIFPPGDGFKSVADFFEMSAQDLAGRCRQKSVVEPRQIAMYLLRDILGLSYPFIGEKLGKRDHTTAIYAYEKLNLEITKNQDLNQKIIAIKDLIYKE